MTNIPFKSLLWIAGFCLISCTSSKTPPPDQQVVLALSQSPSTLDPRFASDAGGMRIGELIFQPLVYLDQDLNIQPGAAESWKQEGNTYTLNIPKNITFSNGRLLKKEDIRFSFDEYSKTSSPFYASFKNIQKINIQETNTHFILKIELKTFLAPFLASDLTVLKLIPKEEILALGKKFSTHPIGTGPFKLIFQDSNQIILESRYFTAREKSRTIQTGNKKIKTVLFKIIRDDLTRFQKILKKEIDIIQSEIPLSKIDYLKKSKIPYQWKIKPGLSMNYLLFNLKDPLFKNKEARQAVAFGINKQNIIKHKLKSMASPAQSILLPDHLFSFKNLKSYPFDFEKAKKMVQKNNWNQKKIVIKTSNNQQVTAYAKVMAVQLRKIGFQVELKSFEWGTFYGDLKKGYFQLALLRWVGAMDPDIYRVAFHSSQIPPKGRNRGFYINKELDKLLEQGRREENIEKRKQIYYQVQNIIAEDLPIVPLWHNNQIALVKNNIKDYFLPVNGSYLFLNSIYKE